jgi:hypothetical protein
MGAVLSNASHVGTAPQCRWKVTFPLSLDISQGAITPTFKGYWSTVMIFRLHLALGVTQTSSLGQKCLS